MTALPVIAIVDDDASVRDAMGQLVRSFDLAVELYASGQALLQS
ncbi:MAG TPA: response regulator, partial [Cupriavidus sp.]|nr:response regulator [Cupriavidus sp.]